MNHIIGPGSERKKIKIYNSPAEYFKSQEFENDQKLKEDQTNPQNDLEQKIKQKEGYVYVPSLKLYISEQPCFSNISWDRAQVLLHNEGKRMPTMYEFAEFLKYLSSDEGKFVVKNSGDILNGIYRNTNQWRLEWLDNKFEYEMGFPMTIYHYFDKGKINLIFKPLDDYLSEEKDISLDIWLNDHTDQGLPKPNCKKGNLSYTLPVHECVSGFSSNEGLHLECDWTPTSEGAYRQVRSVMVGDQ